jgi:hypothetical protein
MSTGSFQFPSVVQSPFYKRLIAHIRRWQDDKDYSGKNVYSFEGNNMWNELDNVLRFTKVYFNASSSTKRKKSLRLLFLPSMTSAFYGSTLSQDNDLAAWAKGSLFPGVTFKALSMFLRQHSLNIKDNFTVQELDTFHLIRKRSCNKMLLSYHIY